MLALFYNNVGTD